MLKTKKLRIVVDTNLWISFIISNKLNVLDSLLFNEKLRILISIELIEELSATITKPKLKKYFPSNALEEMLSQFDGYIDLIKVNSNVKACRDPKDNFLLSLSKDGKADYLLTGDKDLLELKNYRKTKIVTHAQFIEYQRNH